MGEVVDWATILRIPPQDLMTIDDGHDDHDGEMSDDEMENHDDMASESNMDHMDEGGSS